MNPSKSDKKIDHSFTQTWKQKGYRFCKECNGYHPNKLKPDKWEEELDITLSGLNSLHYFGEFWPKVWPKYIKKFKWLLIKSHQQGYNQAIEEIKEWVMNHAEAEDLEGIIYINLKNLINFLSQKKTYGAPPSHKQT
jgi:hypothetical protein